MIRELRQISLFSELSGIKRFVDKQYVMLNLLHGYFVHLVCLGFSNFPSSEILSKNESCEL